MKASAIPKIYHCAVIFKKLLGPLQAIKNPHNDKINVVQKSFIKQLVVLK
jgi:hypothetical protein